MSYKIEINAESINELAGKLLALAATMQAVPADPVMPEVKEAEAKVTRTRKGKADVVAATADGIGTITAPAEEPQSDAPAPTKPAEQPETAGVEQAEATSIAQTADSSETASGAEVIDFEKDVAPLVLRAVKEKGKPWVQEVLSQFGVERASLVDDTRMAELVAILRDNLQ